MPSGGVSRNSLLYLAALVAACQGRLTALPSYDSVEPALRRAARRCGEGQSHTHAVAAESPQPLRDWAVKEPAPLGYEWWEVAAGASSSVAIHALIAAAADPRTDAEEAELIDAAYFPPIGALTVLLDDLVDREEDAASGQHNYMGYYAKQCRRGRSFGFHRPAGEGRHGATPPPPPPRRDPRRRRRLLPE